MLISTLDLPATYLKQIQAENNVKRIFIVWLVLSRNGFCQGQHFYSKTSNLKRKCCRRHIVRHSMVPFLEAKYPGRNFVLECGLATAHRALRTFTSSVTRAFRASSTITTRPKLSPNMVHRCLLGNNQVRNALRRLVRLKWMATGAK